MKEIFSCPIDTPWVISKAGAKEIMSIPKMYASEYMTYGSGRPVTVLWTLEEKRTVPGVAKLLLTSENIPFNLYSYQGPF